jgi:large subunit ribosomal protein L18
MSQIVRTKKEKIMRRARRTRAKIFGTKLKPRLSVFRSNKHIYAQLIDDEAQKTLASSSDLDLKTKTSKSESAQMVGEEIAKKGGELKIGEVIFDKGGYKYHGRVKSVAEGARKGGLKF